MSRNMFITLILFLVGFFLSFSMMGCGKKSDSETIDPDDTVFSFGKDDVSAAELYIYVLTVKEYYEDKYGETVWNDTDLSGRNVYEIAKQDILESIVQTKIMVGKAKEYDVKLNDEEVARADNAAVSFVAGLTDSDKELTGIDYDIAYEVLYESLLADKVMQHIEETEHFEVSDEEARVTRFYDMYFQFYGETASGNVLEYSDEKKKEAHTNALDALATLNTAVVDENKDAGSIEKLAKFYGLDNAKEYALTPNEVLDIYGEDIYNAIYEMENGSYSQVLESEYGYHIFEMIYLTDREETDKNKEIILREHKEKAMRERTLLWQKEIDEDFDYNDAIDRDTYDEIFQGLTKAE